MMVFLLEMRMTRLIGNEALYLEQLKGATDILLNAKDNNLRSIREWIVKALICRCDTEYRALIRTWLSIPDSHVPAGVKKERVREVRQLLKRLEPVKIEIACGDYKDSKEFSV